MWYRVSSRSRSGGGVSGAEREEVQEKEEVQEREEIDEGEMGDGEDGEEEQNVDDGGWQCTDAGLVGSKIPPYQSPYFCDSDRERLEAATTALDYYKMFQPQSFLRNMVSKSKHYAVSRGM